MKDEEKEPARTPPADPFQVWREWLDRSERQWNEWLSDAMESEQFGRSSRRLLDMALAFQSAMNSATHRYFTTLNVPTRADVLALGERLGAIEERLAAIEEALAASAPPRGARSKPAPAPPRPKRTRKPPQQKAPKPSKQQP
jgi:polyhydroxyalkanoic acid synthase PhaR subunit